MKLENSDIPEYKKEIIRDITEEIHVEIIGDSLHLRPKEIFSRIVGAGEPASAFLHSFGFITYITLNEDFIKTVPPKTVEVVTLHETGHIRRDRRNTLLEKAFSFLDYRQGEVNAESYCVENFSGSYQEYLESWVNILHYDKTGELFPKKLWKPRIEGEGERGKRKK